MDANGDMITDLFVIYADGTRLVDVFMLCSYVMQFGQIIRQYIGTVVCSENINSFISLFAYYNVIVKLGSMTFQLLLI